MTFFIVLFIVLMQFLWRYIDDLVGKGLGLDVLGELFFYAAVSMVPMALPLAILLASLMTFGNLGEKSELTAIKAAGIPLIKIMSPLIGLVALIAVGAFFFQNDVLPKAQVKMWTLLFSARQKSPELEIPEGVFYDQIPGYNLYVTHKDQTTGMLYDVMIYDVSRGGDNSTIIRADSARLAFTKDMRYLYLHMWYGEQFENLREQKTSDRNAPFRRESFQDKEVLIPFDANFNRIDEGGMRSQYIGQNITQLRVSIDSLTNRIDSIGTETRRGFESSAFPNLWVGNTSGMQFGNSMRAVEENSVKAPAKDASPIDLDSLLLAMDPSKRDALFNTASNLTKTRSSEMEFRSMQLDDEKHRVRRHRIELIKKFTLSVACLIFLFIGAPLGAIIRKGGLGTPLVISVLLFLFYYIIDNTGYKMAREGYWEAWAGMWLSTFVLLPLGIFVTIKAMNDSSVFNPDLYKEWLRRIFGLPESRHVTKKEVIVFDVEPQKAHDMLLLLRIKAQRWMHSNGKMMHYKEFWEQGYDNELLQSLADDTEKTVKYISDSRDLKVIATLNKFPVIHPIWMMSPTRDPRIRKALMWFFPLGLPIYLISIPYTRRVIGEVRSVINAASTLM
jgi:lipopolysaccharide export system permease protein